jgi:hypothetical protein
MPQFAPIRDIPQSGLTEWESALLQGLKENVELLAGARVNGVRAVMSDVVANNIRPQDYRTLVQISAVGAGFDIGGSLVPSLADYNLLRADVQNVINDLGRVELALNNLIQILGG